MIVNFPVLETYNDEAITLVPNSFAAPTLFDFLTPINEPLILLNNPTIELIDETTQVHEKKSFTFDEIAEMPCPYIIPLKTETIVNKFPEIKPVIRIAHNIEELLQRNSLKE
jgi:hypothetical protein